LFVCLNRPVIYRRCSNLTVFNGPVYDAHAPKQFYNYMTIITPFLFNSLILYRKLEIHLEENCHNQIYIQTCITIYIQNQGAFLISTVNLET